ncbi:hypothetical protein B0H17DRAFT_1135348 [Mycena rosella]|uniref:Uncharacterized protein n=1 Tax=Mycena rosella TaxID=1033263 RepID=A0AAD7GCY5_MYCRO|nr:hypothetical protein B0H17DRAFT_1135348 [Mycena rosella]
MPDLAVWTSGRPSRLRRPPRMRRARITHLGRGQRQSPTPIRKPVAEKLGMNGKVTPRSIAYIAILVYFALTNASGWMPDYYNISLPQMYDFIVDFFEIPTRSSAARNRADDLLTWWKNPAFYPLSSMIIGSVFNAIATQDGMELLFEAAPWTSPGGYPPHDNAVYGRRMAENVADGDEMAGGERWRDSAKVARGGVALMSDHQQP